MPEQKKEMDLLQNKTILQKKNGRRNRSFRKYILALIILVFLYIYVAGDYGLYQLVVKKREEAELKAELTQLEKEAIELQTKKQKLSDKSPEYMEKVAREKYGMAKKGEKVYKVVKKK